MPELIALLDGHPVNSESASNAGAAEDRLSAFGDGIFETMLLHNGSVHLFEQHLTRLQRGSDLLFFDLSISDIKADVEQLIERFSLKNGTYRLKMIVSRAGHVSGYSSQETTIHRLLTAKPFALDLYREANVSISPVKLGYQPLFAGIKHCNRLEQVLAKRAQEQSSFDEALLFDYNGHVVEATSSNIFIIEAESVVTPPINNCGVAGVMREYVIGLAAKRYWNFKEEEITLDRLLSCDAVFLTNALRGCCNVVSCCVDELLVDSLSIKMSSSSGNSHVKKWLSNEKIITIQQQIEHSIVS